MRPRARNFFRKVGRFLGDLIQTIAETRASKNRREPEPCTTCGNLRTIPTVDGGFACMRCEDGYR